MILDFLTTRNVFSHRTPDGVAFCVRLYQKETTPFLTVKFGVLALGNASSRKAN